MSRRVAPHDPRTSEGNGMQYDCRIYTGIGTQIPKTHASALTEWCDRYGISKRDALAAFVEWFLEHEAELEQLLRTEQQRPEMQHPRNTGAGKLLDEPCDDDGTTFRQALTRVRRARDA